MILFQLIYLKKPIYKGVRLNRIILYDKDEAKRGTTFTYDDEGNLLKEENKIFNNITSEINDNLWKNAKKHGYTRIYNSEGKLKEETIYKNGIIDIIKREFQPAGKIKNVSSYKNGILHNNQVEFYDKDNYRYEYRRFKEGKKIYTWRFAYNKNKTIKEEQRFNENMIPDGPHKIYNQDGKLTDSRYYKEGKQDRKWYKYDYLNDKNNDSKIKHLIKKNY